MTHPIIIYALVGGALLAAPAVLAADRPVAPATVVTTKKACAVAACPDQAVPFKAPNGIVVTPGLLNMGRMMDFEARKIQFELTNANTMAVKVLRVRAGCSCTKVTDFPKAPIPPGGKVTVTLEVLSDKLPRGEFQRTAMVEFEGLTPSTVPLKYLGSKTQRIMIMPNPTVRLGKLKEPAATWTSTFEIVGNLEDGKSLVLGVPVCSAPLKAEIKTIKTSHYRLTVTQTGARGWGSFKDRIRVPVTAPGGSAPLLFTFSGRVGELLQVRPLMMWFPLVTVAEKPATVRRTIKISQGAKPTQVVKATDVKVTLPPDVKVLEVTQAGSRATVELEFAPTFFAKERIEKVVVSTPVGQASFAVVVGGEKPLFKQPYSDELVTPVETADETPVGAVPEEEDKEGASPLSAK
ncbi:MAG: DUF1573 domain-containing protein [bacterium]